MDQVDDALCLICLVDAFQENGVLGFWVWIIGVEPRV